VFSLSVVMVYSWITWPFIGFVIWTAAGIYLGLLKDNLQRYRQKWFIAGNLQNFLYRLLKQMGINCVFYEKK